MNTIRKLLAWLFAISSLLCIWHSLQFAFRYVIYRQHPHLAWHELFAVSLFPLLAIIYGIAWWTVWRKLPSGRFWGVLACLTYIGFPLWAMIALHSVQLSLAVMLVIGILLLIVLLWPTHEEPKVPDDDDDEGEDLLSSN